MRCEWLLNLAVCESAANFKLDDQVNESRLFDAVTILDWKAFVGFNSFLKDTVDGLFPPV